MSKTSVRRFCGVFLAAVALASIGCASQGARAIPRDRIDYHEALSSSWKTQMLLNLVRLRYADPPVFLDVASIVNSYSWEAEASLEALFGPHIDKERTLGLRGMYTDRPTVTYSPVMGEKFTKSLMTPLQPAMILSLVQMGYPVDTVFQICLKTMNGVSNQSGAYALRRQASPDFFPLLAALRRIQVSGTVGLRLEKRGGEENAILLLRKGVSPELEADREFVAKTLGLAGGEEYRLVFGALPQNDREISVLTRSMIEIMLDVGSYIDVPPRDVEEKRVIPSPDFPGAVITPLKVRCAGSAPADAYATAKYRGQWFWIDDRDVPSKRLFTFLMMLLSLAETGGHPSVPVLTIPAG